MTDNGRSPAVGAQGLFYQVEAKALLDGVDLEAEHGQMVGLIGPNGAGKSTFLRALSGVLRVHGGSVHLDGADLRALTSKEVAAGMAIVPQIMPYTHGFTAMELVLMGRYPHLGRFQIEGSEDARIAREAMRLTETEQFADRTLDTLSGGERQRVIVSRALAQRPRILLLDEPTANLDVLHQLKVLGLVRQLVDDGLTAVAAFHDLTLAARFCDRLVLLSEGRVLAEGTPEDVLTPERIAAVFGVEVGVFRDPNTGSLAISLIGPADANGAANGRVSAKVPAASARRASAGRPAAKRVRNT